MWPLVQATDIHIASDHKHLSAVLQHSRQREQPDAAGQDHQHVLKPQLEKRQHEKSTKVNEEESWILHLHLTSEGTTLNREMEHVY